MRLTSEKKTNYSLRATSVTSFYIPEKVIQETSGYRSLKALRNYKQTSN